MRAYVLFLFLQRAGNRLRLDDGKKPWLYYYFGWIHSCRLVLVFCVGYFSPAQKIFDAYFVHRLNVIAAKDVTQEFDWFQNDFWVDWISVIWFNHIYIVIHGKSFIVWLLIACGGFLMPTNLHIFFYSISFDIYRFRANHSLNISIHILLHLSIFLWIYGMQSSNRYCAHSFHFSAILYFIVYRR